MKKVKRLLMVLSVVLTAILVSLHPANSTLAETHTYDGKSPYYNKSSNSFLLLLQLIQLLTELTNDTIEITGSSITRNIQLFLNPFQLVEIGLYRY